VVWREADEHAAEGVGSAQKNAWRNDGAPGGWVGPTEEPGPSPSLLPALPPVAFHLDGLREEGEPVPEPTAVAAAVVEVA
jgi:hypothetical protein